MKNLVKESMHKSPVNMSLISYFDSYPKCQVLAEEISDILGNDLTRELAEKIIYLADTYSYESRK